VLIYSAAGIHNAIRDKDYNLPKNSNWTILLFLASGILISLFNKIIFFTAIAAIILGLIYNTISRYILFGDSSVLAITHYTLPCFSCSLLVGINLRFAFFLAGFIPFRFFDRT